MNWNLILRRSTAYLLDVVLLFVVLAPLAVLLRAVLDIRPDSAVQVWTATVLSFSLPAWAYFAVSDASKRGATVGKKLMKLMVVRSTADSGRLSYGRALGRSALKLLPWELAHVFGFALADIVGGPAQMAGLVLANALSVVYFGTCVATGGARSVHDYVAGTCVRE
jgi:uncharacterized RDD family membrane protein YckC